MSPVHTEVLPAVQYLISRHLVPHTENFVSEGRVILSGGFFLCFVPLGSGIMKVIVHISWGKSQKQCSWYFLGDCLEARISVSLPLSGIARCSEHSDGAFVLAKEASPP